jgi:hypothetical protein
MSATDIKWLSPYAQFHISCRGIEFTYKGRPLDKWEVYEMGHRDINILMKGLTKIKANYIR